MWELDNRTDFAVARNWVRDEAGVHQWIVAIKATYHATPTGELELDDTQPLPALAPEYLGEDGASSLRCDSDLGPMKPATDVIVVGSAHAPNGRAVPEVIVGLRVGAVTKALLVRGENVFYDGPLGLTTTAPIPFVTMPLVYERAFGGVDKGTPDPAKRRLDLRNPIGVGFGRHGPTLARTAGPNVLMPGKEWTRPAGFGAICSYWSPRLELSGTYDDAWKKERFPLLPADYDRSCLLCSPEDQRVGGYLRGGETIGVVNMSEMGTTTARVPAVSLRLNSRFGFRRVAHEAKLVTVLVEPGLGRISCVWQSSLAVSATQHDKLDVTRIERA
jgi:hypothetical protein